MDFVPRDSEEGTERIRSCKKSKGEGGNAIEGMSRVCKVYNKKIWNVFIFVSVFALSWYLLF